MSEKIDTEPEVDKSGDDEVEQFGKGEVDEPGKEIVDKPGDDIVDKSGDAEVDECSDKEEDSHGVKLPPLVKSSSAKYSDKTISSKSSNGSFYLKSPKYSIWGRSNVESVLTDYGYAPGDTPALQRPETRERQSTGKKSFSFDDYDVVKARDTRQSRKEYYLKIYEDIHNLRDYCREEYFEKLEEKVCKQRKNMKKSVSFIDPSMRVPPSQKRHYYVSKIHRKPKRDVFLARNYLKNVPKSEHYKIIQLENMLRAEGKLKTQADVDEFWCTTHRPEVFKKYFLVSEQKTLPHGPTSQVPVTMVATLSNPMHQVALSEAPPSLKPMNKIIDYWQSPTVVNIRDKAGHVTSLGKRSKPAVQPALTTMKKEDDPFHHARKAAAELDRKHPQMGIPQLNCFYMDLEEQHRDPEEALRELHNIKHSKERLLFVKRLHRMYSLANANLASTQRILEKRREVELVPFQAECSVVSDLIPIQVRHSVSSLNVAESSDSRPWLKYVERKREITPIQEVSEGSTGVTERGTGERASTPTSTKSNKSTYGGRSVRVHVQDTVPICWESLVHDEDVKVLGSKTPNFYWFNYLGAGQKRSEVP